MFKKPIGAVCSGPTLFASVLHSSVMFGNHLQQTTFSDAFFLGALRVKGIQCDYTGPVGQSVVSLTADPGVESFILDPSHTFMEIDCEITSVIRFLPLIQDWLFVCYKQK